MGLVGVWWMSLLYVSGDEINEQGGPMSTLNPFFLASQIGISVNYENSGFFYSRKIGNRVGFRILPLD